MEELIKMTVALVLTLFLGFLVGPILDAATSRISLTAPKGINQTTWDLIVKDIRVGTWIGVLERFLALASFWIPAYEIIVAWLAFKLAAKWEAWKNVVQFPIELKGVPELEYFRARSEVGSYLLTRFLLGTLANILIGLIAWYVGINALQICPCLKP